MRTERYVKPGDPPPAPLPESPTRSLPGVARWLLLAAGLAIGAFCLDLAAAQDKGKTPPTTPGAGTRPGQPTSERAPGIRYSGRLMVGDPGPDFSLTASDGKPFRLRSLRGREAATLVFLQKADTYLAGYAAVGDSLRNRGIRLIFVCQQGLPRDVHGWPEIVIVHDRQGDVAGIYGARDPVSSNTIPSVFLLDDKAKVLYYAMGRLPTPGEMQAISVAVLAPETDE